MQKQEEDGKIIYQSTMIIARIFADAIVRAQAEIVGISPNENRKNFLWKSKTPTRSSYAASDEI